VKAYLGTKEWRRSQQVKKGNPKEWCGNRSQGKRKKKPQIEITNFKRGMSSKKKL